MSFPDPVLKKITFREVDITRVASVALGDKSLFSSGQISLQIFLFFNRTFIEVKFNYCFMYCCGVEGGVGGTGSGSMYKKV